MVSHGVSAAGSMVTTVPEPDRIVMDCFSWIYWDSVQMLIPDELDDETSINEAAKIWRL